MLTRWVDSTTLVLPRTLGTTGEKGFDVGD
jgi:hypothetical protein